MVTLATGTPRAAESVLGALAAPSLQDVAAAVLAMPPGAAGPPRLAGLLSEPCARRGCARREAPGALAASLAGAPAVFKRCSRCRAARYCSEDCQKADWPAHKRWCFAPA